MHYTRTLRFHADLRKSATFILTFDKLEEAAFQDYFPVVEHDKITTASDFTPIELGLRTAIIEENHAHKFTTPEDGDGPSMIVAENKTTKKIDIGVGFVLSEDNAITAFVWRSIGPNSKLSAQFTPIARAYVAPNTDRMIH
ncbi:hypothetical protein M422DRAFT_255892 [Sphaerobolus stellatus SS14]|uniref:Uncharacterized protein n=1 Tax=Sphaerobolus stellatus (strain SS14) TaxID=990650 RepID=A0A0C9VSK5_SPHS4|nr:hypothetical protein M422DRAFT_273684 [Sphaerobolus stellatus SS14]KIJ41046.1 hypothetical protein M422DRAFT_255892 [Sphaerobolus stellatus SS14]